MTANETLSLMEFCQVWEPALPISPGVLGTADIRQMLWDLAHFGLSGEEQERGPFLVNIGTLGMRGT